MSYSTIPCAELNGSRNESYSIPVTGQSSVVLRCTWANAMNLVGDLLDNRRADPLHPGLFARSATIRGEGGEQGGYSGVGQVITPDFAHVTVTYGSLTVEERDDPATATNGDPNAEVVSETLEPTVEFMTLNHKDFVWGDTSNTPLTADEAPGRLLPGCKLVRNWKRVQTLPPEILSLMGHVNASAYVSTRLGLTFAAETLLYMPPVMTRTITRTQVLAWNVTMSFSYKVQGWNKFWFAKSQDYEEIFLKTDLVTPYKNYPLGNIGPLVGG